MKWVHWLLTASFFAYGRETCVEIPESSLERGDVPAAGAAAAAARRDPAAGPGAVHQPQVVGLDGAPRAAADGAAAARPAAGAARPRAARRRGPWRRPSAWATVVSVTTIARGERDPLAGRRGRGDARPRPSRRPAARTRGWKTRTVFDFGEAERAVHRLAVGGDREGGPGRGVVHRLAEPNRQGGAGDRPSSCPSPAGSGRPWRRGRVFSAVVADAGDAGAVDVDERVERTARRSCPPVEARSAG